MPPASPRKKRTRKKSSPEPASRGLRPNEICAAIKRSGYPFELRLARCLTEQRVSAFLGTRVRHLDGHSREIDVRGNIFARSPHATVLVDLLIEAKSLEKSAAFVVFEDRSSQLSRNSADAFRRRWSGFPTYPGEPPVSLSPEFREGIIQAFAHLNEPLVAVQWALARRTTKSGRPFVDHDDAFYRSIAHIANAWYAILYRASQSTQPPSHIEIVVPTPILALSTRLFNYDTQQERLEERERATLLSSFDVGPGQTRAVPLDIVTEPAFANFVRQCRELAGALVGVLEANHEALLEAAKRQVEHTKFRLLTAAP